MIILFILFIFFLLIENLFLPALIGPQTFLISPLFLAGLVIYGKNFKTGFIQACIFLLVWEIFSGFQVGSFIMPFVITAGLYIWLNHFLGISSGLKEGSIGAGLAGGALSMTVFVYAYSWLFLFFNSAYDLVTATQELKILAMNSLLATVAWSVFFVILFKYARK